MIRKLMIMLVSAAICLSGIIPVLAQGDYPYVWISPPESIYEKLHLHRWIWATPQDYEKVTGKRIEKYNESPLLRSKVAAGELPPVEERLPEEPLVVNPYEDIGEYGGMAHIIARSSGSSIWPSGALVTLKPIEALLRPNLGLHGKDPRPVPNVPNTAKGWRIGKDYRNITLYLRKGMKWSDGEPFTADDIVFYYEDVLQNKDLTPAIPGKLKLKGKLWELKRIDEYTIRFDFATPNPWILYYLATWGAEDWIRFPKHYLQKFHIKYNPNADELAKKEGFDYWYEVFLAEVDIRPPGFPGVDAYVVTKMTSTTLIYERNPYYWKVDIEGNQLPYIDRIYAKVFTDSETAEAFRATGGVDFSTDTSVANYPLYMEGAEKSNYRVLIYPATNIASTYGSIIINQTYRDDLVLRDIFRDVRFRRALSMAIDRDEMNDVFFFGKAKPRSGLAPWPSSIFYIPGIEKLYAEYNSEKSNRLLDEMGLEWDKKHEYRLRPDGKKLSITIDIPTGTWEGVNQVSIGEMYVKYFRKIGVDTELKVETGELYDVRVLGNKAQLNLDEAMSTGDDNLIVNPGSLVFYPNWAENAFCPLWKVWYLTDGEKGEKPEGSSGEELLKNMKKWEQLKVTVDEEERIRLGKDIIRSAVENVWIIGYIGAVPVPWIVRNNLRNVPPTGQSGGAAGTAIGGDYLYGEQFFFRGPLFEGQKRQLDLR